MVFVEACKCPRRLGICSFEDIAQYGFRAKSLFANKY